MISLWQLEIDRKQQLKVHLDLLVLSGEHLGSEVCANMYYEDHNSSFSDISEDISEVS